MSIPSYSHFGKRNFIITTSLFNRVLPGSALVQLRESIKINKYILHKLTNVLLKCKEKRDNTKTTTRKANPILQHLAQLAFN